MDKESLKRLVVFIVGLLSVALAAFLKVDVDPETRQALVEAIMLIVGTYLLQSGVRSAVKDRSRTKP